MDGLSINNIHVQFFYHKRRQVPKVYVSQLSLGVTDLEMRQVFSTYGKIKDIQLVTRVYHDRRLDTEDRVIIFDVLVKPIPSYVFVDGWRSYVKYRGQLMTCRICNGEGHIAKECHRNKQDEPEDMPMDMSSHQPSSSVQPEINSPSSESVSTPVTPADLGVSDSDSLFLGPEADFWYRN